MSPDKQRIAIAEACGWKRESKHRGNDMAFRWVHSSGAVATLCGGQWGNGWGPEPETNCLPDYLTDLNAMHEAVACAKAAEPTFMLSFLMHLQVTSGDQSFPGMNVGTLTEATAAQRAEAFLRAVGKWNSHPV